jgi:hypothetical protein
MPVVNVTYPPSQDYREPTTEEAFPRNDNSSNKNNNSPKKKIKYKSSTDDPDLISMFEDLDVNRKDVNFEPELSTFTYNSPTAPPVKIKINEQSVNPTANQSDQTYANTDVDTVSKKDIYTSLNEIKRNIYTVWNEIKPMYCALLDILTLNYPDDKIDSAALRYLYQLLKQIVSFLRSNIHIKLGILFLLYLHPRTRFIAEPIIFIMFKLVKFVIKIALDMSGLEDFLNRCKAYLIYELLPWIYEHMAKALSKLMPGIALEMIKSIMSNPLFKEYMATFTAGVRDAAIAGTSTGLTVYGHQVSEAAHRGALAGVLTALTDPENVRMITAATGTAAIASNEQLRQDMYNAFTELGNRLDIMNDNNKLIEDAVLGKEEKINEVLATIKDYQEMNDEQLKVHTNALLVKLEGISQQLTDKDRYNLGLQISAAIGAYGPKTVNAIMNRFGFVNNKILYNDDTVGPNAGMFNGALVNGGKTKRRKKKNKRSKRKSRNNTKTRNKRKQTKKSKKKRK